MQTNMINVAEHQAEICKAFSNPTRILILWTLSEEELSVGEIANTVNASIQNTSHHLRIMKDKGILNARRQGQTIFYSIHDREMVESLLEKCPEKSGEIYLERS
jgi:DNA-binding transcriptional ArsR family regulator